MRRPKEPWHCSGAELLSWVGAPFHVVLVLSLTTGTALAQASTVTIDWNDTHQTIDGFGAAEPGADCADPDWRKVGAACYLYNWPEPQRSQIMDLAFSRARGIGLTILRSQIRPELESSQGNWNYTDTAQAWIMKEAVKRGPVKLLGSVWSPPAWMKDNGKLIRGKLKLAHYHDFADFLSHYSAEYAQANGVNIYAVSMANEPDNIFPADPPCTSNSNCQETIPCVNGFCETGWDTCAWTSDEIAAFLEHFLGPTFATNHIGTKVVAPETADWDIAESYLSETYSNPAALTRLDIVAAHLYGGNPAKPFQAGLSQGKSVWQTEASERYDPWDMSGALSWAQAIHDGLTRAQLSAWIWWELAYVWQGFDQELIFLDLPAQTFSISKAFWVLGNFSRFIRPGFIRIGTTQPQNPHLHISAFKDPKTGRFVLVAINDGTSDLDVKPRALGFPYASVAPVVTSRTQNLSPQPTLSLTNTITVPAESVVSYVGIPDVRWLPGILERVQAMK